MLLASLARLVGLKTASQYQSASQVIDETLEGVFGLRADLVRRLDDGVLLAHMTYHGALDGDQAILVADLFREEGEILVARGFPYQAYWSSLRALNFYLEVSLNSAPTNLPPPDEKIVALFGELEDYTLPLDTYYQLHVYFDQKGQYAQAEKMLNSLIEGTNRQEEVLVEAEAFYRRLAELPDDQLEAGQTTRGAVEAGLARVEARPV
jgi:tetratricopeptide (TPR) repeat protein